MMHVAHIVRRPDGEVLGAERLDPMQLGFSAFERLYRNVVLAAAESDDPVGHALAAQTLRALRGSLVPTSGDSVGHEESL
jgi:hypothetical protein